MLSNTMTVTVDLSAASGLASEEVVFSRYEEQTNKTLYVGPNHLPSNRDVLQFARSFPTKVGAFKGIQKTSFKLTKDVSVVGDASNTFVVPLILEVSLSLPVGTDSLLLERARKVAAELLIDSTLMNTFNVQQHV